MKVANVEGKATPLVFVVDDEPTTVRIIEQILKRSGFRTASAGTIAAAIEGIRQKRPNLILLDVNLADGSGFDVCRVIQSDALTSSTPILFISADNDTTTKVKGFEAGGVDYITKPIAADEVIARVRTHLRLKEAYERLSELQAERVQKLASAQQTLMPRSEDFPEARFQVYLNEMCEAGGDFYDVISSGEGIVDYLVADASGHDLAASYWTAALKALAAEYATPVHLPLDVVRAINSSLCRFLPSGAFFTMIYARLNHLTGKLSMINAGHPPAIIVRAAGGEPVVIKQDGDVVGAFNDAIFGSVDLTLHRGDRLYLYSDGVVEVDVPVDEGVRRLAYACQSRQSIPLDIAVVAAAQELTAAASTQDDRLLMGVER